LPLGFIPKKSRGSAEHRRERVDLNLMRQRGDNRRTVRKNEKCASHGRGEGRRKATM